MVSFAEPARLSFIFDAEDREQWQKSSAILQRMALHKRLHIAAMPLLQLAGGVNQATTKHQHPALRATDILRQTQRIA